MGVTLTTLRTSQNVIRDCRNCELSIGHKPVTFTGNPKLELLVMLSNPDPQTGKAGSCREGRIVREELDKVGINPDRVSWGYSVSCHTRKVKVEHQVACQGNRSEIFGAVSPRFVLLVGEAAWGSQWHKWLPVSLQDGRGVYCSYPLHSGNEAESTWITGTKVDEQLGLDVAVLRLVLEGEQPPKSEWCVICHGYWDGDRAGSIELLGAYKICEKHQGKSLEVGRG